MHDNVKAVGLSHRVAVGHDTVFRKCVNQRTNENISKGGDLLRSTVVVLWRNTAMALGLEFPRTEGFISIPLLNSFTTVRCTKANRV